MKAPASLDHSTNVVTFQDGSRAYFPLGYRGRGYEVSEKRVETLGYLLPARFLAFMLLLTLAKQLWDGWQLLALMLGVVAVYFLALAHWLRSLPQCSYRPTREQWMEMEVALFDPVVVGVMFLGGGLLLILGVYLAAVKFLWIYAGLAAILAVGFVSEAARRYLLLARIESAALKGQ